MEANGKSRALPPLLDTISRNFPYLLFPHVCGPVPYLESLMGSTGSSSWLKALPVVGAIAIYDWVIIGYSRDMRVGYHIESPMGGAGPPCYIKTAAGGRTIYNTQLGYEP